MDKNKYKNTFCTIDMQLDTIRCNNFLRTWITNSVKNYIKIFESHVLSSLRNVRLCSIKMERRWFEFENGFFYLKKTPNFSFIFGHTICVTQKPFTKIIRLFDVQACSNWPQKAKRFLLLSLSRNGGAQHFSRNPCVLGYKTFLYGLKKSATANPWQHPRRSKPYKCAYSCAHHFFGGVFFVIIMI